MLDGYGMGTGGWLAMVVIWLTVPGLVVWAFVHLRDRNRPKDIPQEHPHDILDRRLALGEIDVDTYDRVKAKIGKELGPP